MSFPRRLRGEERGFSLIEMLTVMVDHERRPHGPDSLFVQGSNSQLDMNRRFEAQQDSPRRARQDPQGDPLRAGSGNDPCLR